ncbi:acyltransferase family protein [Roseibium denhamense]|uniref:Exopolysaccharide production protein ExoZ n=2 Tax=Roseibium denhamense TaxID=76305 RepID=A0ABY1PJ29_9HYPH|nr:acyltransferase [Roseibium denhamense]SMP34817.1 exopolysaccharide production protein ExoZ [Roseibium denhamense]
MLIQLQYARAIAALLVVYFHSVLQMTNIDPELDISGMLFGEAGVDLFFVISGFVMWYTTAGRPSDPRTFLRRRVERIVPLYWFFTLAAAAVAFAAPSLLKSTQFDLQHLVASLLFLPWPNPSLTSGEILRPVVIPGWTLNFEMYFYLLFAVTLFMAERYRIAALAGLMTLAVIVVHTAAPEGSPVRFYGDLIVYEFLAGVCLAHLYLRGRLMSQGISVAIGLAAALLLIIMDNASPDLPHVLVIGVPAMIVIYALISIDFSKLPEWRFLHLLGDASYSLYLSHVFVLAALRTVVVKVVPEPMQDPFVFLGLCIVASVVVAIFMYHLFEKPVAEFFRRRRSAWFEAQS